MQQQKQQQQHDNRHAMASSAPTPATITVYFSRGYPPPSPAALLPVARRTLPVLRDALARAP
eukprot:2965740-Alexandrium_andersonii.AAC.1